MQYNNMLNRHQQCETAIYVLDTHGRPSWRSVAMLPYPSARSCGVTPCSGWLGAPDQTTPFVCGEANSGWCPHGEDVRPPFPCVEPLCCLLATAGSCELLPAGRQTRGETT